MILSIYNDPCSQAITKQNATNNRNFKYIQKRNNPLIYFGYVSNKFSCKSKNNFDGKWIYQLIISVNGNHPHMFILDVELKSKFTKNKWINLGGG